MQTEVKWGYYYNSDAYGFLIRKKRQKCFTPFMPHSVSQKKKKT